MAYGIALIDAMHDAFDAAGEGDVRADRLLSEIVRVTPSD